ncbi:MAG TPA: hypothetical protein VFJ84_01035 [Candidatus Saccharimonadales bacterium]|nr:hypothetical protein [Candidatus Saccharimonadales bacterium]
MKKPNVNVSTKSLQIDKAQQKMLGIVMAATVVTIFCLTGSKVLVGKAMYQQRVISARNSSATQLSNDVADAKTLTTQYKDVFIGSDSVNIIGGNANITSSSSQDGDNGKIVLDALPTTYDFPALLTSLSNMLGSDGVGVQSIGGTDQSTTITSDPTYNPQTQKIDLTISATSTYNGANRLLKDLERSIRPFDVTHVSLSGDQGNMVINLDLTTYYQPAKTLIIPSKEIK